MTLYLVVVTLPALVGVYLLGSTCLGLLRRPLLGAVRIRERAVWPKLAIVSPACNEEKHIVGAVESMLAIDYPDFRVVAVNDRSTDATGPRLDALAATTPKLTVLHLHELPDGWLGKLNALRVGVEACESDWLLFMDADSHLGALTLKRAITYCDEHAVDCLSVVPEIASAGFVGDAVFDLSLATLSAGGRLQAVSDPKSRHVAATGAFILVRKVVFDRTPGFAWIRLEVADDFGLALLIKTHGGRCDIVNGRGEVTLEWYASFREMAAAMQKNVFAIVARFSALRALGAAVVAAWMALYPLAMLLHVDARLHAIAAVGVFSTTLAMVLAARATGRSWLPALFPSIGFLGFAWMALRSGFVGARVGGIAWRGVVYPTSLLRENQRVRP